MFVISLPHVDSTITPRKVQSILDHTMRLEYDLFRYCKRYAEIPLLISRSLSVVYFPSSNFVCYSAFIAFRLYALWDQRRSVKVVLGVLLVVTYVPMFVTGGISAVKFYSAQTIL